MTTTLRDSRRTPELVKCLGLQDDRRKVMIRRKVKIESLVLTIVRASEGRISEVSQKIEL